MIDYSKCTESELLECLNGVDPEKYPENYKRILEQIRNRGIELARESLLKRVGSRLKLFHESRVRSMMRTKWVYPDICESAKERAHRYALRKILTFVSGSMLCLAYSLLMIDDMFYLSLAAPVVWIAIIGFGFNRAIAPNQFIDGVIKQQGYRVNIFARSVSMTNCIEFETQNGLLKFCISSNWRTHAIGTKCILELSSSGNVIGYRECINAD